MLGSKLVQGGLRFRAHSGWKEDFFKLDCMASGWRMGFESVAGVKVKFHCGLV